MFLSMGATKYGVPEKPVLFEQKSDVTISENVELS
jgi:hypothetical protein